MNWSHPMPALLVDGTRRYLPKVSDTYSAVQTKNPPHRRHVGVDVMYERRWPWKQDTPTLRFKGRETSGNKQFFFPSHVPIHVAADGVVWSVTRSPTRGIGVLVVHQRGQLATWYQHLADVVDDWQRGDKVARGTILGHQGYAPNGDAPIHLHFGYKVWDKSAKRFRWRDPEPLLLQWPVTFDFAV